MHIRMQLWSASLCALVAAVIVPGRAEAQAPARASAAPQPAPAAPAPAALPEPIPSPLRPPAPGNPEAARTPRDTRAPGAPPTAPVPSAPGCAPHTLAELEALALRNNPTIQAAEALVQQQVGLLRQVGRYPNPTVGWVQSTPSRRNEGATSGAFISQDFVTAGKIRLAKAAGRVEVEWRSWQLKAQVGRVVNDVRIRYYEVLGAQHAMAAARELERLAAEDLRAVRQLLEAKQASRPDELQAEIHVNAVRSVAEDARLRHQTAWRQLANLVGEPALQPALLPEPLEGDVPQLDWETSLQRIYAESPVLRAQETQIREAAYEAELARRQVIPNVSTQVVIQRDYVKNFDQVSTLVSVPLPVFNRNRGNILNAEATLRQQQQEFRRVQLALADQLATAFQQYASARNQVERLREILPRTQENLELTTQAFKTGQTGFNFMRVLDAEQTYYQTKSSYIDALTSLRKIAIEVEGLELSGGLNPTEVGTALQAGAGPETGVRNVLLQQAQQQNAGVNRLLPGSVQSTIGER